MLLLITDGVGLTRALARQEHVAKSLLGRFFHDHIRLFSHFLPLKSTGDGLVAFADVATEEATTVATTILRSLSELVRDLSAYNPPLKLRAVLHSTGPDFGLLRGSQLCEQTPCLHLSNDGGLHARLQDDIFGLDVILAFRVLQQISGSFCVATTDFINVLVGPSRAHVRDSAARTSHLSRQIDAWNVANGPPGVYPSPIYVPYLKGLTPNDIADGGFDLENPYEVWEVQL
jgi:hypothetical protein